MTLYCSYIQLSCVIKKLFDFFSKAYKVSSTWISEAEHRLKLECVSFSFSLTQKNSFSYYSKIGDEKQHLFRESQTKKTVAKHLITLSNLTEINSAWINISSGGIQRKSFVKNWWTLDKIFYCAILQRSIDSYKWQIRKKTYFFPGENNQPVILLHKNARTCDAANDPRTIIEKFFDMRCYLSLVTILVTHFIRYMLLRISTYQIVLQSISWRLSLLFYNGIENLSKMSWKLIEKETANT